MQASCLPGNSTVYQLLEIYQSIVNSIDDDIYCCMIFCELSTGSSIKVSFINRRHIESPGHFVNGFISYFSNRTQKAMYKNKFSLSSTSSLAKVF